MKNREILEIISQHPFFGGMDPKHLATIAGCGSNRVFKADELLAHEGAPSDHFYLIRHGRVAIEMHTTSRGHRLLQTLAEGDIVGWSWLFPPHYWNFDVRAIDQTRVLALDGKCLRGKCEADKEMGYELMKRFARVMADRLQSTRMQLMDFYGD